MLFFFIFRQIFTKRKNKLNIGDKSGKGKRKNNDRIRFS